MGLDFGLALFGAILFFLLDIVASVALSAISALSRVALHRLGADSEGRYEFLGDLKNPASTHRVAIQLFRQCCLLGASGLGAVAVARAGLENSVAYGVATAVVLGVIVSEGIVAHMVAGRDPRMALRASAGLLRLVRNLLYPIVLPMTFLRGLVGQQAQTDERREEEQEEEVEALIEVGEREGLLEGEEGAMMRGIVDLDETRVREIMTPRIDILTLPVETTVEAARRTLLEAGHSRMPVYRESIDHVVGVLHERDLFRAWEAHDEQASIESYVRPALSVPETLSGAQLLAEMRTKTKMAVVLDEFGGLSGLVTLEDLLEEIVGDIRDEHEQDEEDEIVHEADGSYTVRAMTRIDDLEKLFGLSFDDRDFDTVGGLVVTHTGRVPATGEHMQIEGLYIEVLEADRQRIKSVRVRRAERDSGASDETNPTTGDRDRADDGSRDG